MIRVVNFLVRSPVNFFIDKHSKGKALSILAHRLARAVYFMLKRNEAFDMGKFLQSR